MHLDKKEGYNWGFIRSAYGSVSDLAVIQMQDILGLGNEARMNTPSTLGGNWTWRAAESVFSPTQRPRLYISDTRRPSSQHTARF